MNISSEETEGLFLIHSIGDTEQWKALRTRFRGVKFLKILQNTSVSFNFQI